MSKPGLESQIIQKLKIQLAAKDEENKRLNEKLKSKDKEIEFLKEKVGTLESGFRMIPRGKPLSEVINNIPEKFTPVYDRLTDEHQMVLWHQADFSLQLISRDVLDVVAYRWSIDESIPDLDGDIVEIRDDKPLIPHNGKHRNYPEQFTKFLCSIFSPHDDNHVFQDLKEKLADPNLSLYEFQQLYFHMFFQSREEITAFPGLAHENLRDMGQIWYRNSFKKWSVVYEAWAEARNQKINFEVCYFNEYTSKIFDHMTYTHDNVDEARLVRNMSTHFNDPVAKDPTSIRLYNLQQIGEVIFALFPKFSTKIFDFFYELELDVDFCSRRKLH